MKPTQSERQMGSSKYPTVGCGNEFSLPAALDCFGCRPLAEVESSPARLFATNHFARAGDFGPFACLFTPDFPILEIGADWTELPFDVLLIWLKEVTEGLDAGGAAAAASVSAPYVSARGRFFVACDLPREEEAKSKSPKSEFGSEVTVNSAPNSPGMLDEAARPCARCCCWSESDDGGSHGAHGQGTCWRGC